MSRKKIIIMTSDNVITAVPSTIGRVTHDNRCQVASQALAAGSQEVAVRVLPPLSGPQQGQIAVRVGRILIYVANREALESFLDAWSQAERLADDAFGPLPR